jgi:hypothetical protein
MRIAASRRLRIPLSNTERSNWLRTRCITIAPWEKPARTIRSCGHAAARRRRVPRTNPTPVLMPVKNSSVFLYSDVRGLAGYLTEIGTILRRPPMASDIRV